MYSYYVIPVGNRDFVFEFTPYQQLDEILNTLGVPFKKYDDKKDIKHRKRLTESNREYYKYIIDNPGIKRRQFYFRGDTIEKFLKHYSIPYIKTSVK